MNLGKLKDALRHTWLHPRYLALRYLEQALSCTEQYASGQLLDIGCGRKPYKRFFAHRIASYVGVDMPASMHGGAAVDAYATALALPFATSSVDAVLATEVIEHVPDPTEMVSEIARVLRPAGHVIVTAPLHEPLHELPFDYFRYTHLGLTHLLAAEGLEVVRIERRGGPLAVSGYLLSSYLYRHYGAKGYPARLKTRVISGPIVIGICAVVQLVSAWLDQVSYDEFDTLGYVIVARRTTA